MASLLRQIVAGPRARHPEANLDLCYVTDNIIATSGPSGTYPQLAYRNPLDALKKFLDKNHGDDWAIWEFRAEGTGYPDEAVYNRIWHYPWPDHHPPPFGLVPNIMASMRDWLKGKDGTGVEDGEKGKRVVVVHCKAGKGRSGTASCSYLISEEGWTMQDAIKRFTERRMKPGWGSGVSIPSQLRWLTYVERWKNGGKIYVERKVEVTEVHVWGLRDGVTLCVRGYIEEGKKIKVWHTFSNDERKMIRGKVKSLGFADAVMDIVGKGNGTPKPSSTPSTGTNSQRSSTMEPPSKKPLADGASESSGESRRNGIVAAQEHSDFYNPGADAIFRPKNPIILDTNDINIDCERRTKGGYTWAVVTSVAHVWFNTFFEGNGPEQNSIADDSGVFEIDWDKMDGIKGSSKKGTRCFDRMSVVWKVREQKEVVTEPREGEEVKQAKPADWKGASTGQEAESSDEEDQGTQAYVTPQ